MRPIGEDDVAEVLRLNAANVAVLSPMTAARLEWIRGMAQTASVVEVEGQVAGFVLTVPPQTDYDSEFYRWFEQRYGARFCYLDRVVVDGRFRRRGVGGFCYDEVETRAREFGRLTLEVNVEPPNRESLAFHAKRGFSEVGRLSAPAHEEAGTKHKVVSLMSKELG